MGSVNNAWTKKTQSRALFEEQAGTWQSNPQHATCVIFPGCVTQVGTESIRIGHYLAKFEQDEPTRPPS